MKSEASNVTGASQSVSSFPWFDSFESFGAEVHKAIYDASVTLNIIGLRREEIDYEMWRVALRLENNQKVWEHFDHSD